MRWVPSAWARCWTNRSAPGGSTTIFAAFYLGCRRREADGALPAGAYASVFYRGPYSQLADVCAALWPRLAAQGLRQDGPVMELYHIDAHDTARVDEYLTEVQVRVARAGQKGSGEHGV